MAVADASVLEGLDEYTGTVNVEQNSIRPEPTLARNLWALPKRGGSSYSPYCFDRKLFTFWCDRVRGARRARDLSSQRV